VNARLVLSDVLLSVSLLVTVLAAIGAVMMRTTFGRLHFLTPVTTVGAPLFCVALVLRTEWGITAGLQILIIGLLALAGPVLQMAIARVEAQQQGVIVAEGPE
jgi:multicomponent Na+:H+ antiporter subunit G